MMENNSMKITTSKLKKIIQEALTDMLKADYVGTEVPSEMRTVDQVTKEYTRWVNSEGGSKLLTLIKDPDYLDQANVILDTLSMGDLKVPPDAKDYLFVLSLYVYELGQILLKGENNLYELIYGIDVSPEVKAQGIELFDVLIQSIDDLNLELDYTKYELTKAHVEGKIKKSTRSLDSWTDNTFSAMQQVIAPANQNENGKNLGLYLVEIDGLTYDTLGDLARWIEFFGEYLSDFTAVIGEPGLHANIGIDDDKSDYHLTYLVIAAGDINQVTQHIDNELNMIDMDMFQDADGVIDSGWHRTNEFWSIIADSELKLESYIQQLIAPGDFESLRNFINKSGAGLVDFEEYSAQEFNSMIPKALEIIWNETKSSKSNSNLTTTSFAHDAGYNLVSLVNDLKYVDYDLDYIGP